jgi:hypothetical protein
VFDFQDNVDIKRVLSNEPWTFDKHLVVFQQVEDKDAFETIVPSKITFWVQFHNILIRRMKKDLAKDLGRSLGTLK